MAHPPIAHHVILRLDDDRVIARTTAERRAVARTMLRVALPFGLVAFRLADNHLHNELDCTEPEAAELARRAAIGLHRALRLVVGFAKPRIKPIMDQGHATSVVHYTFRQEKNHGSDIDPLFDASNLPDLLGMRLIGGYTEANLRTLLPRIDRNRLLVHLGVTAEELDRAPLLLEDLPDAAAAIYGLPDLRGRSREVVAARLAAIQAMPQEVSQQAVADILELSRRSLRRLRAAPVDLRAARAVRQQLKLRGALRQQGRYPAHLSRYAIAR